VSNPHSKEASLRPCGLARLFDSEGYPRTVPKATLMEH